MPLDDSPVCPRNLFFDRALLKVAFNFSLFTLRAKSRNVSFVSKVNFHSRHKKSFFFNAVRFVFNSGEGFLNFIPSLVGGAEEVNLIEDKENLLVLSEAF